VHYLLQQPVSLELGGKSPLIIFDDVADIDKAVEWAMFGCFFNGGQVCSATSRLLLHVRMLCCLLWTPSYFIVHDMKIHIFTGENCGEIFS
jgi:hypothetical protein